MAKQLFISGPIYPKQNDFWGFGNDDWNLEKLRGELKAVKPDEELRVFVNSPGGVVIEGFAMKTELEKYNATIIIQGMAGSIASVISMGGKRIEIAKGSAFMLHNPSGMRAGNQDDMQAGADVLAQMREQLLDAYEEKTGLERSTLEDMVQNPDRWVFDSEAVSLGFADDIYQPDKEYNLDIEKERNVFGERAVACFVNEYNRRNPKEEIASNEATQPKNGGPDMAEENTEIRAELEKEFKANAESIRAMAHSSQSDMALDLIAQGKTPEQAALTLNEDLKARLDNKEESVAGISQEDHEKALEEARSEERAKAVEGMEEDSAPVINSEEVKPEVNKWDEVSKLQNEHKFEEAAALIAQINKEGAK